MLSWGAHLHCFLASLAIQVGWICFLFLIMAPPLLWRRGRDQQQVILFLSSFSWKTWGSKWKYICHAYIHTRKAVKDGILCVRVPGWLKKKSKIMHNKPARCTTLTKATALLHRKCCKDICLATVCPTLDGCQLGHLFILVAKDYSFMTMHFSSFHLWNVSVSPHPWVCSWFTIRTHSQATLCHSPRHTTSLRASLVVI